MSDTHSDLLREAQLRRIGLENARLRAALRSIRDLPGSAAWFTTAQEMRSIAASALDDAQQGGHQ